MNRFKKFITLFAFSILIFGLPTLASAQWRDNDDDDDYYGNNRNNRGAVQSAIERLKNQSKVFKKNISRSRNSDGLERLANDFKENADDLEDEYDNGRNMSRSQDEAQRLIYSAEQIDREIRNGYVDNYTMQDWRRIQSDLRIVADAYGIRYRSNSGWWDRGRGNGKGNGRGNGRGNGGWRDRVPFPLPF